MGRWITFLAAAFFIFGTVHSAWAGWGAGPGRGFIENPVNLVDELKLSDEQAAQIRELNETQFQEMSAVQEQMRRAHHEFRQQQFTPGVKQEQLREKAGEIQKLQGEHRALSQKCPQQMRKVLTEEQYRQWVELRAGPGPNQR